jgi:chemotaxis response regulator CheB
MAGPCGEGTALEFVCRRKARIGLGVVEAPAQLGRFLSRRAAVPAELNRAVRMADLVVVIAASAGGLDPLRRIIAALPFPARQRSLSHQIGPYPSASTSAER